MLLRSPYLLVGGSLLALASLAGALYWINRPKPELVVYAGSMLRPALEEAFKEFEEKEGVKITRVYNGCGILVGQMQVADTPDVYFACDVQFMDMVKDKFDDPKNISNNQLVIVVKKGNPKEIYTLNDLGQEGLKVGVGHEKQCALGQLTHQAIQEQALPKMKFFGDRKRQERARNLPNNIKVHAPSGDYLVADMLAGALDAVIAYKTNVAPYPDKLESIPITGVP
jgi:ABC-type molybdate transport system substrate-binding protein